jgi:hypothetical protein
MTLTLAQKRLASVLLEATPATAYTSPASTNTRIDACSICNSSPDEQTVTIWLPQGGSPSDANVVVRDFAIAGNDEEEVPHLLRQVVEAGETVVIQASTGGVLTLTMSGPQFITS